VHTKILVALVAPMLWACSTTPSSLEVSFPAQHPVTLTPSESLAFEIAKNSFLSDRTIQRRFKDLSHYDVEMSAAGSHVYVHFIPLLAHGESPRIGCCTNDAMEVSFDVDLPSKRHGHATCNLDLADHSTPRDHSR
jgi:hypothetical protein